MEENDIIIKYLMANKINVLLGAGAPKVKLENSIDEFPLMSDLILAVERSSNVKEILSKIELVENHQKDIIINIINNTKDNVEEMLSALENISTFIIDETLKLLLQRLVNEIKDLIVTRIVNSKDEEPIKNYYNFFSALRNLNEIKNFNNIVNVFSTNYDMLCEKSFEKLGIHYYNGFIGNMKKVFNPTFYKYKYVENIDLNRTKYYQKKDHFNLYKIHGSFSWRSDSEGSLIEVQDYEKDINDCKLIHPSSNKFMSVALLPYYSTLLREFSNNINQEKSVLLTIGYGYGDVHINSLIKEALMLDQFTLIACIFDESKVSGILEYFGGDRNNIVINYGAANASMNSITKRITSSFEKSEKGEDRSE